LITVAGVVIQMALAFWQGDAGFQYAKSYEARTGRRAFLSKDDPHPIMFLLRPSLGEPKLFAKQSDAPLEASRGRYIWRRNVFIIGTLLDWTVLIVLLNINAGLVP
jgi:hypothetical protein